MRRGERRKREFQQQAVDQLREKKLEVVAQELDIAGRTLYRWKERLSRERVPSPPPTREQQLEAENQKLKVTVGNLVLERDFFANALQAIKDRRQRLSNTGAMASTSTSGE